MAEYIGSPDWKKMMDRMAEDILFFGKIIMPEAFRVASPEFHKELCELAQDDMLRRVNIIAPRGHAKSTVMARLVPMWHIFLEDYYYGRKRSPKFVVCVSRTQDPVANDHVDAIKGILEQSSGFRDHFGDFSGATARQWSKTRVELKDGSLIVSKGSGQQFVGLLFKGRRPTLIILDDLEDETNTENERSLENNFKWLVKSVEPCVDPQVGRIISIGTPKHRNCIVERLDKHGTGYASKRFSAIIDENTPDERALWEEWKPLEALKAERDQFRARGVLGAWIQEYMCRVSGESGSFQNINYWDGDVKFDNFGNVYLVIERVGGADCNGEIERMRELEEPEIVPVNTFLGCDPQISQSQRADYGVTLVRGVAADKREFVIDVVSRKGALVTDQAHTIVDKGAFYKVTYTAVETVAYQEALRQRTMEVMREHEPPVYLTGIDNKNNPKKKKKGVDGSSRLEEMQPVFELGRMYIRPEHTLLRNELQDYPNGDDNHLDALYYSRVRNYLPTHTADMLSEKRATVKRAEPLWWKRRRRSYDPKTDWRVV